jgi:hypothetical protein
MGLAQRQQPVPKTPRKRGLTKPTTAAFGLSKNACSEYTGLPNSFCLRRAGPWGVLSLVLSGEKFK